MIRISEIEQRITETVDAIAAMQLPSGGFESVTAANLSLENATSRSTTFYTSLIASALCHTQGAAAACIRERSLEYIASQQSSAGSYNYWDRSSEVYSAEPYPDDMDDTACATAAFAAHDRRRLTPETLARFVTLLTHQEESEGGPYRTWIVPAEAAAAWHDVDLVVNCNIAYALKFTNIRLPRIDDMIAAAIADKKLVSPYYVGSEPVAYFMARAIDGAHADDLKNYLLHLPAHSTRQDPLAVSLIFTALCHVQAPLETLEVCVRAILDTPLETFIFPAAFVVEKIKSQETHYSGCAALTLAILAEGLSLYKKYIQDIGRQPRVIKNTTLETIGANAYAEVHARLVGLPAPLADIALHAYNRVTQKDTRGTIVGAPAMAVYARAAESPVSAETLSHLGALTVYGWIAYTLYDDFLDGEGDPRFLSAANTCLRELSGAYAYMFPKDSGFHPFMREIMDTLDAANTWEVEHCRAWVHNSILEIKTLPDYTDEIKISERSMGHILGSCAAFVAAGSAINSPEIQTIRKFFTHYIVARQLNDDIHDWEADLQRGNLTIVVCELIKAWVQLHPDTSVIDLALHAQELQTLFWREVVVGFADRILAHGAAAAAALKENSEFAHPEILINPLTPLLAAAEKVKLEHASTLEFLAVYSGE